MNNETKETIANASDALEAISGKMYTASELAALALEEVCDAQPEMGTIETLLNSIIDSLDYQSGEVQYWSRKLDRIGGKHE